MKIKSAFLIAFLVVTLLSAPGQTYLTNGLVAFYPFNGNAIDQSGNNNGSVGNAFLISDRQSKSQSAYGFSGNAWINLPHTLLDGKNNSGTISLWFKTDSPNPLQLENLFAAHGHGIGQPNRIYLTIDKGRLIATIGNPSQDLITPPIFAQKWYHVCLVWNNGGNSATLYLDGKKIREANGISLKPSIEAINLGAWKQENGFLHGAIDEVRIYNRSLLGTEVKSLFDYELNDAEQNTIANREIKKIPADIPQATLEAAAKMEPPTNNYVELSKGKGEVVTIDSKGIVLKEAGDFLPRIPLTELTENDFRALLENKKSYDAFVSFKNGKNGTAKSDVFESEINATWRQAKTLGEKIKTRLEILDDLRAYNNSLSAYIRLLGFAHNESAKVDKANTTIAVKEVIAGATSKEIDNARELRTYGISGARRVEYEAQKNLKRTEAEIDTALKMANSAANNQRASAQQADAYLSKCQFHAFRIAKYGISISTSPPFETIPTLSLKFEVDIDRIKVPRATK